jgi:hypothetical protein
VRVYFLSGFFKIGPASTREKALVFILRKKRAILIRTGDYAIAAANTFILVDPYYPVFTLL